MKIQIFFPRSFGDEYDAYEVSNRLASQPSKSRLGQRSFTTRQSTGTGRPRINSSGTIIGKTNGTPLESHRRPQVGERFDGIPTQRVNQDDISKFARSPTKEQGASNTFLLTDSPVPGLHALDLNPHNAATHNLPPLHLLAPEEDVSTSSNHIIGSWTGITSMSELDEHEFGNAYNSPQAPRTWQVHNRNSDIDELDKTTTTELSRKQSNRSVVSVDSIYKTGAYSLESTPGLPPPEVNYAYLHSTPQLYKHPIHNGFKTSRRHSRGKGVDNRLTSENLQWFNAHTSKINPLVYIFKSPIGTCLLVAA